MMAFLLGARAVLKHVPWQIWAAIGLAFVIWRGIDWHEDAVSAARKQGDKAGFDRAVTIIEIKARALAAKADAIAAKARRISDEKARTVSVAADDLRVSGPGAARCASPPRAASPRRPDTPGRAADAPAAQVPTDDRAAVPWQWLVGEAEVCDLNRNEVVAWRDWHTALTASAAAK